MKAKILTLAVSILCILTNISYAQSGYPAEQGYQADAGYPAELGYQADTGYPAEQGQPAIPQEQPQQKHKKHHHKNKFSINLDWLGDDNHAYAYHQSMPHYDGLHWVSMHTGQSLPHHAVVGGHQPDSELYICRTTYNGGVHPGKLYLGNCNIGWGGEEIIVNDYEVLSSRRALHWVRASYGSVPAGAVQGGYESNGALYICRVEYNGGVHPGKIIGQNCNFGWGGKEVAIPYYKVLVR